jgi:CrcB protein
MYNLLLVAIGGAIGASSRYLLIEAVIILHRGSNFPAGTILVNIFGSFLMGIMHFLCVQYLDSISLQTRLFVMTGVLGSFTTFSAFSVDVLRLFAAEHFALAFGYILSSVIFSILAIFLGFYLTKLVAS